MHKIIPWFKCHCNQNNIIVISWPDYIHANQFKECIYIIIYRIIFNNVVDKIYIKYIPDLIEGEKVINLAWEGNKFKTSFVRLSDFICSIWTARKCGKDSLIKTQLLKSKNIIFIWYEIKSKILIDIKN